MNKQGNYIITAFLLFFLFFGGIFIVSNLSVPKKTDQNAYQETGSPDTTVSVNPTVAKGKSLFLSKCASCHNIFKEGAYPSLLNFQERGPWSDKKNIYSWVRNPSAFLLQNEYARKLKEKFGGITMTAFPDITDEEIDAVITYINSQNIQGIGIPMALN